MLGMDQTACGLQMAVKMDRKPQLILDNPCRSIYYRREHQCLQRFVYCERVPIL